MGSKKLWQRYCRLKEEVQEQKVVPEVTVIAVSKGQSPEFLSHLYEWGHRDFGENYALECVEKAQWFASKGITDIRWHFLGSIQTNKLKKLLPFVSVFHGFSQLRHELYLEKKPFFVQVRLDPAPQKSGVPLFSSEDQQRFLHTLQACSQTPLGLMAMTNPEQDPKAQFEQVARLSQEMRAWTKGFLSMGMSHDFKAALACGATHIRIGRLLWDGLL